MAQVIKDTFELLTFRISRDAMLKFGWQHLIFGLVCTWLVGMGRYWDNPRVEVLQHLGIGSVVYIFALSLLLWLVVLPMRAKDWSYRRVLTFVSMVSPPAVLYAIPVQYLFDLEVANSMNVMFLSIVSLWRVSLLFFFLQRFALLNKLSTTAASLFLLTFIVVTIAFLNLERVVFDAMSGNGERTSADSAYDVVTLIAFLSVVSFPITVALYVVAIAKRRSQRPQ